MRWNSASDASEMVERVARAPSRYGVMRRLLVVIALAGVLSALASGADARRDSSTSIAPRSARSLAG